MFNLAISCFTTSNSPWLMYLTFQVPLKYWFLQPKILLSWLDTSIDVCHFHVSPVSSLSLELSVIAFWLKFSILDTFGPGKSHLPVSHLFFFFFLILFMVFSRLKYWNGLPFPYPMDHIFSELFAMTYLSWVVLQSWFIDSLNYASPLTMTRLQSMKGKNMLQSIL